MSSPVFIIENLFKGTNNNKSIISSIIISSSDRYS